MGTEERGLNKRERFKQESMYGLSAKKTGRCRERFDCNNETSNARKDKGSDSQKALTIWKTPGITVTYCYNSQNIYLY